LTGLPSMMSSPQAPASPPAIPIGAVSGRVRSAPAPSWEKPTEGGEHGRPRDDRAGPARARGGPQGPGVRRSRGGPEGAGGAEIVALPKETVVISFHSLCVNRALGHVLLAFSGVRYNDVGSLESG